jgi:hypothetical protein
MRHFNYIAFVFALFLFAGVEFASAQLPAVNTTIQLPTTRSFGVNTVVSVPDGGTMVIGGGSAGTVFPRRRGLSRSIRRRASRPGISISPTLIIGAEVEAELRRRGKIALAERARPDIHGTVKEKAKALFLAKNLGRGLK